MVDEVESAKRDGDTLGGVVEVPPTASPPGLGSHVHWDRRLDSQLAAALMGIQAIKGVEVGDGFETTRRRGSVAHDELHRSGGVISRDTDRAGGTEGGMSTGTVLRVRAGMKPIATVPRALATIDVTSGEESKAHHQRSDVCAVPRPAWSPSRWSRSCSPTRCSRSSAETRWARPPATSGATSTPSREPPNRVRPEQPESAGL